MNWEKLFEYIHDIRNIPKYKLEIYKLKKNNIKLNKELEKKVKELIKLSEEYINYKKEKSEEILKLKQKKISTKDKIYDYLDRHYKRVILEYQKRWVLDKKDKPVKLLANDFIKPNSWLGYKFKNKSLKDIWKFKIKYTKDDYAYNGVIDVWQLPIETYTLKAGDCDDSTAFRVATAKSVGLEKDFKLFMAVGFYIINKQAFGHAFPVLIYPDGRKYILEATSNNYSKVKYPNKNYEIHYLWDENFTWKIQSGSFGGKVLKEFSFSQKKR